MKTESKDPYYENKKRWRLEHKELDYEIKKRWRLKHKELDYKSKKRWANKNRETRNGFQKKYAEYNPEKIEAQSLANRKVKIKGFCEICKVNKATEKHHPDYAKPLEVMFLCLSCHKKIHKGVIDGKE